MIRPLREEDVPAVAALRRLVFPPDLPMSDRLLRHQIAALPGRARLRWWVAEEDGEVVGAAQGAFRWASSDPGSAKASAVVRPDRRGRGIGSALFTLAEAHVLRHGATSIDAEVYADPAGERFVRARGYEAGRSDVHSVVVPTGVDVPSAPDGFALLSLRDLRGRERDLWRLDAACVSDIPADAPNSRMSFDEWRRETYELPELDRDGSLVAAHGDDLVAYAWMRVDGDRAENEMTGTLPSYRRLGLARLLKLATIAWAHESGIRSIATANDTENAGMLALNASLGYRPVLTSTEFTRRAAGTASARAPGAPAT